MKLRQGFILSGLVSLLSMSCIMTEAASKKIYVLADIHVMGPSLVDNPSNEAWQEDLEDFKTMQDLSVPIFNVLIERIKNDKPDMLLIAGDLTKSSEVESHMYVLNKLSEIKNAGIPVYVIPGNRDRGFLEDARKYINNSYTAAEMIDNDTFARLYSDYGYGPDSERFEESLTYVTEPFLGLTLIGLDDGIWVNVGEGSINWICQKAKEAHNKGNQVLLMTHHMIMPHYYRQDEIFELSASEDYINIRKKLMDAGITVVLTGHTHVSDIARYTDINGRDIYDIATGSPISYPCDFRILTFNTSLTRLDVQTVSIDRLNGYNNFPEEAKSRLEVSTTHWVNKWLAQNLGNSTVGNILASEIAYCFKIHAEGNEPRNPDTPIELNLFKIAQEDIAPRLGEEYVNILDTMAKTFRSMLGDYQTEEDSTNIVDDRTLTIEMPKLPTGIIHVNEDSSTEGDAWYTLQGGKLDRKPTKPGIYIHNGRKRVITTHTPHIH